MIRCRRHMVLLALLVLMCGTATTADPASANRDAVAKCLLNLARRAQEYYWKPWRVGGEGGSFATINISDLTSQPVNSMGSFVVSSPTATSVTLTGTGVETGYDESTPLEVEMVVYSDSITVTVTN